jgi:DNA polymerase III gamma/tau subunit
MQEYQPFHLKYRPQTLSEVIGQKHVTQTLTNAIQTKKIAAAYLFTGGKGTEKPAPPVFSQSPSTAKAPKVQQ